MLCSGRAKPSVSLALLASGATERVACVATARGTIPCRRTLPFAYLVDQALLTPVEARAFELPMDAALTTARQPAASTASRTAAYLNLMWNQPLSSLVGPPRQYDLSTFLLSGQP